MAIETIATAAAQTAPSPAAVTQSASYRKYLRGLRHRALIVQAWQIGLVALFLGVWEIAPRAGWINPMLTSYPSAVARTLLKTKPLVRAARLLVRLIACAPLCAPRDSNPEPAD